MKIQRDIVNCEQLSNFNFCHKVPVNFTFYRWRLKMYSSIKVQGSRFLYLSHNKLYRV